ncbi:Asp23/Gls24 family envelope stress response protein [Prauserella alba]|uniref:Asp23 family, cell envelope-related function n=1 Tax=Prauserella alba TaxID=176898 RepID=A0ABP4FU73_9PSEU|nr:Asp23/Gls24 family envelope stress response protein [Prauserella alba]MCP2181757.1 Asp23 family, cell envelope-related function [Prauserella alba]
MTATSIEERGQTTIATRTVERIATAALAEVDDVGGSVRRVLNIAVGSADSAHHDAQVTAQIQGNEATLGVRLSVTYPTPVSVATEAARSHLIRRVTELTGLAVPRVDITVTALHAPARDHRRVL